MKGNINCGVKRSARVIVSHLQLSVIAGREAVQDQTLHGFSAPSPVDDVDEDIDDVCEPVPEVE